MCFRDFDFETDNIQREKRKCYKGGRFEQYDLLIERLREKRKSKNKV